jgi:hypothetical protein
LSGQPRSSAAGNNTNVNSFGLRDIFGKARCPSRSRKACSNTNMSSWKRMVAFLGKLASIG